MKEEVWGGSIELRILSDYYSVEIVTVDTQNVRVNRFGEDKSYGSSKFERFRIMNFNFFILI